MKYGATATDQVQIIAMHKDGSTVAEIASRLQLHEEVVSRFLPKAEVKAEVKESKKASQKKVTPDPASGDHEPIE